MNSLRDVLASSLLKRIEKELGRETTLRLLWPSILGPQLATNTKLKQLRGATLVISVPDRAWIGSLSSMSGMILDAVNRLRLGSSIQNVELVVETHEFDRPAHAAALPDSEPPPVPQINAEAIADPEVRERFVRSAEKYLARRDRRK